MRIQRHWLVGLLLLLALLPLALLWPKLRHFIEARMLAHMLIEFPLLVVSGWTARSLAARWRWFAPWNQLLTRLDWWGLTSATVATCVAMFWMVPAALDAALLVPAAATAKYLSWWIAGLLLAGGWPRMAPEIVLFFVGNLSWTCASVGMLYTDTSSRLCANYLVGDQSATGTGLVLLALLLGGLALAQIVQLGDRHKPRQASKSGLVKQPADKPVRA